MQKLGAYDIKNYTKETEEFIISGDMDTIKTMLWNNTEDLKPVSNIETIPNTKWIKE